MLYNFFVISTNDLYSFVENGNDMHSTLDRIKTIIEYDDIFQNNAISKKKIQLIFILIQIVGKIRCHSFFFFCRSRLNINFFHTQRIIIYSHIIFFEIC